MKKTNIGICRLCDEKHDLRESHIVPKLFYRFIKKNSPTGRFRNSDNPNIPRQDGEQSPFLCGNCEEIFSKYESFFSNNIYQNIIDKFGVENFDSNLDEVRYFTLSISWRVLRSLNEKGIGELSEKEHLKIDETLESWRKALYEENFNYINTVDQYIIPTSKLGSYFCRKDVVFDRDMTSKIINNVCADFKTFDNQDDFRCAFTTIQVPYMIFVTIVWGEVDGLDDYKIGNTIIPRDFELPSQLRRQLDIFHKEKFAEAYAQLTEKQKSDILNLALKKTGNHK